MRKNPWITLTILLFIFGTLFTFLMGSSAISLFGASKVRVTSNRSILHLKLEGIILDGSKFLKPLLKYEDNDRIRAVVIEVNSPGGVVGPSQEIYSEIKRVREVLKKPVVVVAPSLIASGAYYAAVAANNIVVQPGTLIGSIGVIMEFTNLEKLYDWAKIKRFSITTGKYKDSGNEYRPMRPDERELFQTLIDQVWWQFKKAVAEGRGLRPELVDQYADGRVLTGEQAVNLGFADKVGTVRDAMDLAGKLAGLGTDYEVFEPAKERHGFFDLVFDNKEDASSLTNIASQVTKKLLRAELSNQPLYLMSGYW